MFTVPAPNTELVFGLAVFVFDVRITCLAGDVDG
jgi:hypothetical protein